MPRAPALFKSDQVRPFDFQKLKWTSTEQLLTAPALLKSDLSISKQWTSAEIKSEFRRRIVTCL